MVPKSVWKRWPTMAAGAEVVTDQGFKGNRLFETRLLGLAPIFNKEIDESNEKTGFNDKGQSVQCEMKM